VTVQRAYADWRRYPQYIVPLSEASVDLIFAPAYGSSKKNATDIRMAIDGMELVFTRPEIGTYILLTGRLGLLLSGPEAEGVREVRHRGGDPGVVLRHPGPELRRVLLLHLDLRSPEDQRFGTGGRPPRTPGSWWRRRWSRWCKRNDVMRSDRLKQVMLEIDPGFEEKSFGFSKFSRFLTEAAQKGTAPDPEDGERPVRGDAEPGRRRRQPLDAFAQPEFRPKWSGAEWPS
jgi:hypothetical protein